MTGSRCGSATQRLSFPQRRKFPARAGVSPSLRCCLGGCVALPRASGGVSTVDTLGVCAACPSPRERGCLHLADHGRWAGRPFPARAGVSPWCRCRRPHCCALPRASGGVSQTTMAGRHLGRPFPARAGVSPNRSYCLHRRESLPRASGGIILAHREYQVARAPFPARAGVSPFTVRHISTTGVNAGRAGVSPSAGRPRGRGRPLPRASGGVSLLPHAAASWWAPSPRERGGVSQV